MRWQIAAVMAGLLAALAVIVTQAPASLLDPVLSRFTQGRVRLAQAQGTLWQGSGRIVLADIREASSSPAPVSAASVPGVVIPGTFGWRISPVMLLIGALDARIHPGTFFDVIGKHPELPGGASGLASKAGFRQRGFQLAALDEILDDVLDFLSNGTQETSALFSC